MSIEHEPIPGEMVWESGNQIEINTLIYYNFGNETER